MKLLAAGALLGFAATASAGGPAPLELAARYAGDAPDCAKRVPLESNHSYPLPIKTDQGPRFRMYFYPAVNDPKAGPRVHAPSHIAEFDSDGRKVRCDVRIEALFEENRTKDLGSALSPAAKTLSYPEFNADETRLYAALDVAAAAFFSGRRDTAAKAAAGAFLRLFDRMAEPPFKPYYRKLSPDFWDWTGSLIQGP